MIFKHGMRGARYAALPSLILWTIIFWAIIALSACSSTSTPTLPYPSLVPSAITFFTPSATPNPAKKVFAHYMLSIAAFSGAHGTLANYEEEIIMAQTLGIDGFAIDVGAWNSEYQQNAALMFQAAADLNSGFVIFLTVDGLSYQDIISFMMEYANNPNYFKYNGQPVLSAFYGEGASQSNSTYPTALTWWPGEVMGPLAAQGINCFFIPDMPDMTSPSTPASEVTYWSKLVNGLFTFTAAMGVTNNDGGNDLYIPTIGGYQVALSAINKIYMAGAVAKYWGARQPTNGNIYFEWQGGAGIDAQWKAIIADNVPWVELITWNDFNESYIMPMDDFEKYNDWGQPLGWWKPTFGYAELLRYYIAWFKTGAQPTITNDSIFWFYRTQPAAASAANATTGGEGQTGPVSRYIPNPPSGAVPSNADQMFVTVMATVPGTLTSSMGNFSAPVVAGINQFTIPFVAGPAPTFQLSRNGATVINATGADVILANPPYYNWWASSGFAEGNSVRQALEIAVQPRKGP